MKHVDHQTFGGIDLHDMTQGMLETFLTERERLNNGDGTSMPYGIYRGNVVRAALHSGILNTWKPDDVGDMKPALVIWLHDEISLHVGDALEVPPASSSPLPTAPTDEAIPPQS